MVARRGVMLVSISVILILLVSGLNVFWGLNKLLEPQLYESALDRAGIYSTIDKQLQNKSSINFIIVGPGGVRESINLLIEKSLEYVRGDSDKLEVYWEVNKSEVREFFKGEVEKLRYCNDGENPLEGEETICRPKNMSVDDFLDRELAGRNVTILDNNETRINVVDIYDKERNIDKFRSYVALYREGIYLTIVFITLLLTIIFLVDKGRPASALRWIGLPLMIGGIITLIIASMGGNLLYTQISIGIPLLQPGILEIISPVFNSIKIKGIFTLVIGFILLTISFFFNNKEDNKDGEK